MKPNPLKQLLALGQSIWLDYISRELIEGGTLRRLIEEDGLRGMTSNPAIFEKAIVGGAGYGEDIRSMTAKGMDVAGIYEALSQRDVRLAAEEFRGVYDESGGVDGYVSLEVNPHLANDTEGTLAEARRLWRALDRPNVFIKVPATREGLPAIRQLIAEGINVNVTLLFGVPRYREVAEAYIAGLEARAAAGKPVGRVASVASFFVSRIDAMLDPQFEKMAAAGGPKGATAAKLRGEVAIANARMAYQTFKEVFGGERWKKLAAKGARVQRLLWASTSTKNPDYPDVKYVEALIGPDTVNTAPLETIDAYRDHGMPKARIEDDMAGARRAMQSLADLGIDFEEATRRLEEEGVEKFNKPFDAMMASLGRVASRDVVKKI